MRGQPGDGALYVDTDGTEHKAVIVSKAESETAIIAYSEGNTFRDADRRMAYYVPHIGDVDRDVRCFKHRRVADWVTDLIDSPGDDG